jgi:hypothetical protein
VLEFRHIIHKSEHAPVNSMRPSCMLPCSCAAPQHVLRAFTPLSCCRPSIPPHSHTPCTLLLCWQCPEVQVHFVAHASDLCNTSLMLHFPGAGSSFGGSRPKLTTIKIHSCGLSQYVLLPRHNELLSQTHYISACYTPQLAPAGWASIPCCCLASPQPPMHCAPDAKPEQAWVMKYEDQIHGQLRRS